MNVAENLYDYLKHNNLAEIPGLGTFTVKEHSAEINFSLGNILPPSRKVSFTTNCSSDKSFVSYMAQKEFISEETANTWIKQYADFVKDKLDKSETVNVDKLGTLSKGIIGEYSFTPAQGLNLMGDSFALGELKNVKTYSHSDTLSPIRTKTEPEKVEQETLYTEALEKKKEIEKKIEETKQLKEENKINETQEQTTTRIIQHSEAVVDTDVEKPVAESEITEKLSIDATPTEDKTQQTIDRAEEFKEDVVVEDIKPAERGDLEQEEQAVVEEKDDDDLKQEAKDIINKFSEKEEKQKKKNKRKKNARKKFWKVLCWIVLILLFLCLCFVGAHYMGWLKDIKALKPITQRLEYYIPARTDKAKKTVEAEVKKEETVSDEPEINVQEVSATEESAPEIPYNAPDPVYNYGDNTQNTTAKQNTNKPKTNKTNNKTQKETTPKQESKPVTLVEDNTPVLTQNYSKLGFDVVDGTYSDKKRAEQQAKKAKSLGYDSYVLSKIKSGQPIYYVSYGSRRTLTEANDLMQSMKTKMGGNYYVISR
ncbi:MAG: SPOR domain-containing protein [Bacteroidales bacterium]|nr:SPOR domain-containing protein [Bacteroidales bacterium]